VWFCGASSEVSACVWVGHPGGRVSMPGATGGSTAAPIWNDFMVAISGDIDPEPFPMPDLTGEILKASPVPGPSPTVKEKEKKEEEEKDKPSPKPSPPPPTEEPEPSPPPTTPPPTTPPPTTPPANGGGAKEP